MHTRVRTFAFPFLRLFPILRSPVLEPDFHLTLREVQGCGELGFPSDGDVFRVIEFLLELQPLMIGVNYTVLVFRPRFT